MKRRSAALRHVARTHRVNLVWLYEVFAPGGPERSTEGDFQGLSGCNLTVDRPGVIGLRWVDTNGQAADFLTKRFPSREKWQDLLNMAGIVCRDKVSTFKASRVDVLPKKVKDKTWMSEGTPTVLCCLPLSVNDGATRSRGLDQTTPSTKMYPRLGDLGVPPVEEAVTCKVQLNCVASASDAQSAMQSSQSGGFGRATEPVFAPVALVSRGAPVPGGLERAAEPVITPVVLGSRGVPEAPISRKALWATLPAVRDDCKRLTTSHDDTSLQLEYLTTAKCLTCNTCECTFDLRDLVTRRRHSCCLRTT